MIKLRKSQAANRAFHWRPNFRDYNALPPVRAVRTNIFIPVVFIAIALVFAGFILFREYQAMTIRAEIDVLKAEIEEDSKRHDEIVGLNAEFMKITKNLDEITKFVDGQLVGSEFLIDLTSRIKPGMYLTRIEYAQGRAMIEGRVGVAAEQASRIVDEFLKSIQEAEVLQGIVTDYKLTLLERANTVDTFNFRIEVTVPLDGKGKK